jgi:hypothetical protein
VPSKGAVLELLSRGPHSAAKVPRLVQHHGLRAEVVSLVQTANHRRCTNAIAASKPHCVQLLQRVAAVVHHQVSLGQSKDVYDAFVANTSSEVLRWNVTAANPNTTDRVAVIVLLQGIVSPYIQNNVEYVVRSVSKRLGPRWALQIFHGRGQQPIISKALGNPAHVVWTQAELGGKAVPPKKTSYNELRWSPDFYEAIDARHEHVLVFELDSLVLRSKCIDDPEFFKYDLLGAPGGPPNFPLNFMNGGFTLRKRSVLLNATKRHSHKEAVRIANNNPDEDNVANYILKEMDERWAPAEVAMRFSLEQVPHVPVCGFHKPWLYESVSPADFKAALDQATF